VKKSSRQRLEFGRGSRIQNCSASSRWPGKFQSSLRDSFLNRSVLTQELKPVPPFLPSASLALIQTRALDRNSRSIRSFPPPKSTFKKRCQLGSVPPDFLWKVVALANVMRRSSRKGAYAECVRYGVVGNSDLAFETWDCRNRSPESAALLLSFRVIMASVQQPHSPERCPPL
jgi:hypothetical protein